MPDTPELTRYSVLQTAVLNELLSAAGVDRKEPGLAAVLQELDALTMTLAHRSRSAVQYDAGKRGKAALEDAAAFELARAASSIDRVEWTDKRWSQEQAIGPFKPTDVPDETVKRALDARGVSILSPEK